MAKGVQEAWSTTAGDNGAADSNINAVEGMKMPQINDAIRGVMAACKAWWGQIGAGATYGGSSNAYTLTSASAGAIAAYVNGMRFLWKPNANSSGEVTLNVDGAGAKKVYRPDGTTQAGSGDILSSALLDVVYLAALDGGNGGFQIVGFNAFGYQPIDADLTAIAALSYTSGAYLIKKTAANTWALIALTAAGEALLDDVDAAAQRTTLGLGSAALVADNTLMHLAGTETVTGVKTFAADLFYSDTDWRIFASTTDGADNCILRLAGGGAASTTRGASLMLAGNEHAAAGQVYILAGGAGGGVLIDSGAAAGAVTLQHNSSTKLATTTGGISITGLISGSGGLDLGGNANSTITNSGAGRIAVEGVEVALTTAAQTLTDKTLTSPTITGGTSSAALPVVSGVSGTLTTTHRNVHCALGGDVTLPNSVFTAGDKQVFDPGTSSRTFSRGSGVTMYVNGADVASATLAANRLGGAHWRSASVVVLTGAFS